jgi:hypothetical protein
MCEGIAGTAATHPKMQNERENLVHSFELPGAVCVFYLHTP